MHCELKDMNSCDWFETDEAIMTSSHDIMYILQLSIYMIMDKRKLFQRIHENEIGDLRTRKQVILSFFLSTCTRRTNERSIPMIHEDCRGASLEESWFHSRTQLPDESRGLCRSRGKWLSHCPHTQTLNLVRALCQKLGVGLAPQSGASPSYKTKLSWLPDTGL